MAAININLHIPGDIAERVLTNVCAATAWDGTTPKAKWVERYLVRVLNSANQNGAARTAQAQEPDLTKVIT